MPNEEIDKIKNTTPSGSFLFPKPQRVALKSFSLFSRKPNIEINIPDGVLCLAGANGIGKSTLLASVNFALTGCVPDPNRKFQSAAEYSSSAARFTDIFFEGRISETDREEAAISVAFTISDKKYELTRALFNPNELINLKITTTSGTVLLDGEQLSGKERDEEYKRFVIRDTLLKTFDQYIFLQHFVFTFDESRHLLFWDKRALEQALYLCFGGDPQEAAKAEELRRSEDKFDSRGRNLKFQANNVHKRIQILEEALGNNNTEPTLDLDSVYKLLIKNLDEATQAHNHTAIRLNDSRTKLAQLSATIASLRTSYQEQFAAHLQGSAHVEAHPLVSELLEEGHCSVCGATNVDIALTIKERLKAHTCPVCTSPLAIETSDDAASLAKLKDIDHRMGTARGQLDELIKLSQRLERESTETQVLLSLAEEKLRAFEAENEETLNRLRGKNDLAEYGGQKIVELKKEHDALISKSREAYAERDKTREGLKNIQRQLQKRYAEAEEKFVPTFRKLAHLFLGIDLDVRMENTSPQQISLVIELKSSTRREFHQLSESQRFFIDIALRMALAQYMSSNKAPAPLFIDTPEGSLDIAYESRAGDMFASFAFSGHNLLMTANINSSELLRKLAQKCGASRMHLVRMTGWADLSDVQLEEEDLFKKAYEIIEAALHA